MEKHSVDKHKAESGNSHVIIIIILVVAILGWLGYTYQYSLQKSFENVSINNSTEAIKEATRIIKDKYKFHANGEGYYYAQTAPPYEQPGINYYVISSKSSRVGIDTGGFYGSVSKEDTRSVTSDIQSLLISNGFNKMSSPWLNPIYVSNNSICMFSEPDMQFQLSCAELADYADAVNAIAPLVNSILDNIDGLTAYSTYTISKQNESGYQNATLEFVTSPSYNHPTKMYFYKKSDSNWQYYRSSVETICSIFNTPDLKAAFYGTGCYDDSTKKNGTVK